MYIETGHPAWESPHFPGVPRTPCTPKNFFPPDHSPRTFRGHFTPRTLPFGQFDLRTYILSEQFPTAENILQTIPLRKFSTPNFHPPPPPLLLVICNCFVCSRLVSCRLVHCYYERYLICSLICSNLANFVKYVARVSWSATAGGQVVIVRNLLWACYVIGV